MIGVNAKQIPLTIYVNASWETTIPDRFGTYTRIGVRGTSGNGFFTTIDMVRTFRRSWSSKTQPSSSRSKAANEALLPSTRISLVEGLTSSPRLKAGDSRG